MSMQSALNAVRAAAVAASTAATSVSGGGGNLVEGKFDRGAVTAPEAGDNLGDSGTKVLTGLNNNAPEVDRQDPPAEEKTTETTAEKLEEASVFSRALEERRSRGSAQPDSQPGTPPQTERPRSGRSVPNTQPEKGAVIDQPIEVSDALFKTPLFTIEPGSELHKQIAPLVVQGAKIYAFELPADMNGLKAGLHITILPPEKANSNPTITANSDGTIDGFAHVDSKAKFEQAGLAAITEYKKVVAAKELAFLMSGGAAPSQLESPFKMQMHPGMTLDEKRQLLTELDRTNRAMTCDSKTLQDLNAQRTSRQLSSVTDPSFLDRNFEGQRQDVQDRLAKRRVSVSSGYEASLQTTSILNSLEKDLVTSNRDAERDVIRAFEHLKPRVHNAVDGVKDTQNDLLLLVQRSDPHDILTRVNRGAKDLDRFLGGNNNLERVEAFLDLNINAVFGEMLEHGAPPELLGPRVTQVFHEATIDTINYSKVQQARAVVVPELMLESDIDEALSDQIARNEQLMKTHQELTQQLLEKATDLGVDRERVERAMEISTTKMEELFNTVVEPAEVQARRNLGANLDLTGRYMEAFSEVEKLAQIVAAMEYLEDEGRDCIKVYRDYLRDEGLLEGITDTAGKSIKRGAERVVGDVIDEGLDRVRDEAVKVIRK